MRVKKICLSMCFLFLSLWFFAIPPDLEGKENTVIITLKPFSKVEKEFIYLSEIIEEVKADEKIKKRLFNVKIGRAPLPGKIRTLNSEYILVRLYQNGFSPGSILLEGDKVVVERKIILSAPLFEEKQELVKKGDIVNIVVEGEGLRIVCKGRALESGKKGEEIEVINLSSFKKIRGKIISSSQVRVDIWED